MELEVKVIPVPDVYADRDAERIAERCEGVIALLDDSAALASLPELPWTQLAWLPWYPADFYGNGMVAAMSDKQELWYRRLLDRSWQMACPCFLPSDPAFLANLCRCTPLDLQADGAVVLDRFQRTGDGKYLYHPRMFREYLKVLPGYLGKKIGAQKTNQKRREKKQQERSASRLASRSAQRYRDDIGATTTSHISQPPIKADPPSPPGAGPALLTPITIGKFVCRELNFSESEMLRTVRETIQQEFDKMEIEPEAIGTVLVDEWRSYLDSSPGAPVTPRTFFGQGIWKTWRQRSNGNARAADGRNRAQRIQDDIIDANRRAKELLGLAGGPVEHVGGQQGPAGDARAADR
jgi:hypothetical protein